MTKIKDTNAKYRKLNIFEKNTLTVIKLYCFYLQGQYTKLHL